MNEIVDWIQRLNTAERSKDPKVSANFRRILIPGWKPAEFDGFLRAEGQQAFTPFGGTPVSFSVLEWLDTPRARGQTLSELPTQIGGMLSLVADRKIVVLMSSTLAWRVRTLIHFFHFTITPMLASSALSTSRTKR